MNENIERSIISNALIRGNTHYYKYNDAIRLVDLCYKNGIPVLGIDSFIVTETRTQPFMEHSIDLSTCGNPFETAKSFLKEKKEYGFVFEIVY